MLLQSVRRRVRKWSLATKLPFRNQGFDYSARREHRRQYCHYDLSRNPGTGFSELEPINRAPSTLTLGHTDVLERKDPDLPYRIGKALIYAVLLWVIGFVWGSIVFMTPALKTVAPIPYVSRNPAISFPILIMWLIVTYLLAKSYLKTAPDKVAEGLKLGIVFSAVNILLDLLILVLLLKAGFSYFVSLTVWLAYFMLLMLPWMTGRSLQRTGG